jgi:hypothetical protein
VYGMDKKFLKNTLREPNSCKLRTSEASMLPITTQADDLGRFFFIAGDLRVDEHALLTCMHTVRLLTVLATHRIVRVAIRTMCAPCAQVWMREHNRLCDLMGEGSPDKKFKLAQKVCCIEHVGCFASMHVVAVLHSILQ